MKTATPRAGMKKPEWWIDEIVEPALADYLDGPRLEHRALSAIQHANHIADRVFHFYDEYDKNALLGTTTEGDFLRAVIDQSQSIDLRLVYDACDSSKHHFLRPHPDRFLNTATDTVEDTSVGFVVGGTDDYLVEDAVRNVIEYWRDWRTQRHYRRILKGLARTQRGLLLPPCLTRLTSRKRRTRALSN